MTAPTSSPSTEAQSAAIANAIRSLGEMQGRALALLRQSHSIARFLAVANGAALVAAVANLDEFKEFFGYEPLADFALGLLGSGGAILLLGIFEFLLFVKERENALWDAHQLDLALPASAEGIDPPTRALREALNIYLGDRKRLAPPSRFERMIAFTILGGAAMALALGACGFTWGVLDALAAIPQP